LTVNAVNSAPTGTPQTVQTDVEQTVQITLQGDDGDPEVAQTISFALDDAPMHGTITNFNMETGVLDYTPEDDFMGTDTFTYIVTDNGGTANGGVNTSQPVTVTIQVGTATQPPVNLDLTNDSDDGQFNDD